MNEVIKAIKERRSVKSYKPDAVPTELLDAILEAGTYAPTGRNMQSPIIIAVTDKNLRDKISKLNAEVMGMDGDPFYGAPAVLVVLADKSRNTYLYDGSLVMENLMLAAHNEGVGCCWVMHFDPTAMREKFNIPENVEPTALLVMGYPAEDAKPLDMHFKSRPMEETVVYDEF